MLGPGQRRQYPNTQNQALANCKQDKQTQQYQYQTRESLRTTGQCCMPNSTNIKLENPNQAHLSKGHCGMPNTTSVKPENPTKPTWQVSNNAVNKN